MLRDYGILNKHLLREWLQGKAEPGYKYDGRAVCFTLKRDWDENIIPFLHTVSSGNIPPLFYASISTQWTEQQQIAGGHFNIFTFFFLL